MSEEKNNMAIVEELARFVQYHFSGMVDDIPTMHPVLATRLHDNLIVFRRQNHLPVGVGVQVSSLMHEHYMNSIPYTHSHTHTHAQLTHTLTLALTDAPCDDAESIPRRDSPC